MEQKLDSLVAKFSGVRIGVVGEAMLDGYLEGTTRRLCREAPVPLVGLAREVYVPGGAANAAVNAAALGAEVRLLTVVGRDEDARRLRRAFRERGLADEDWIASPRRSTLSKQRVLADGQILLRFDRGDESPLDPDLQHRVASRLARLFDWSDAIIVSDYGCGLFVPAVIRRLARLQRRRPRIVTIDSRWQLPAFRRVRATIAKPNYREALTLLGPRRIPDDARVEEIGRSADVILDKTGTQLVAVTLDSEGALLLERSRTPYRTYAEPRPNSRAAGAGDTFAAALTLGLASGGSPAAAAEIASAAAAVVVAKDGTATCTQAEAKDAVSGLGKVVADVDRLAARVAAYRASGRSIVFTNGCFDILHRGHVRYLNQAKACGDILIVGVNSDDSVRRLKGPGRPVNALDDRLQVLAALSCVDCVVAFEDDTSRGLVEVIRPEVFVKGGDYREEQLPEAPLVRQMGGEVRILPYLSEHSTSLILERLQAGEGIAAAPSAAVASS